MTTPLPDYYDSLDAAHSEAWRLLVAGATDRESPFHYPVISSVDAAGRPHARTVILRAADQVTRTIRFHTDLRSAKVAHFGNSDRVCVTVYDAAKKIQLRIDGRVELHTDDALADAAWEATRQMTKLSYANETAPGTTIEVPITLPASQLAMMDDAGDETITFMQRIGRENFCAVLMHIESIEWVYLVARGNRRALFTWQRGVLDAKWLQP
jgi:hypothetical protein